jgi:excisionase family DNA binding protein
MDGQLLSVTAAAKYLGFSRWTVNEMCRRFELPFIPRGRKGRRIARKDIDAWVESHKVHNQDELRQALDGRRK